MPVTCVKIRKKPETGRLTADTQQHVDEYQVTFGSMGATRFDALAASCGGVTIPAIGQPMNGYVRIYRSDGSVAVQEVILTPSSIEAGQDVKNPLYWNVRVTWELAKPSSEQPPGGSNVRWRIEFASEPILYTEPSCYDGEGNELRLKTGEPIVPEPTREFWDEEFIIKFRTDYLDLYYWEECQGGVNSESVTVNLGNGQSRTFGPGTMKFPRPRYQLVYTVAGVTYWDVEYRFQIRIDTWKTIIQPKSLCHRFVVGPGVSQLKPNVDPETSHPFAEPKYLNADGTDWVKYNETLPDPMTFMMPDKVSFTGLLRGIGGN